MSEKEKRKPEEPEYAPFWMHVVFVLILLVTSIFPIFHILHAYPHIDEYRSLTMPILRWLGFILCVTVIIRSYLEPEPKRRNFLLLFMLIVAYATIFHEGVGLMVLGAILSPFALIIFVIFLSGLILMRIITRKIYTWEIVSLIILEIMLSLGVITFGWFASVPYQLLNSQNINDNQYHLMLYLDDSTLVKLYQCNHLGLSCQLKYTSAGKYYYYYHDDVFSWEVIQGEHPTITIFVNDEAIHTETITTYP